MRITESTIRRIIREEARRVLREGGDDAIRISYDLPKGSVYVVTLPSSRGLPSFLAWPEHIVSHPLEWARSEIRAEGFDSREAAEQELEHYKLAIEAAVHRGKASPDLLDRVMKAKVIEVPLVDGQPQVPDRFRDNLKTIESKFDPRMHKRDMKPQYESRRR